MKYSLSGKDVIARDLAPLLSGNEKAKAAENRRMFLDEGFDLIMNNRRDPQRLSLSGRPNKEQAAYDLLIDSWDISEKKQKKLIEFVEIDIASWRIINTYSAETAAKWESATIFILLGGQGRTHLPDRSVGSPRMKTRSEFSADEERKLDSLPIFTLSEKT